MNPNVKKAWEAYVDFVGPVVEPVAKRVAGHTVERLLGFWVMWHFMGGLDGLIESKVLSKATVYRQRAEFHYVYGVDVADFLPHIAQAMKAAAAQAQEVAS
jgi:hypothetical protein